MSQIPKKKVEKKSKQSRKKKNEVSRITQVPSRAQLSVAQSPRSGTSTMVSILSAKPKKKPGPSKKKKGTTKEDTKGTTEGTKGLETKGLETKGVETAKITAKPTIPQAAFTTGTGRYLILRHFRNPIEHGEFFMKDNEGKMFNLRFEPTNRYKLKFVSEVMQMMAKEAKDEKAPLIRCIEYGDGKNLGKHYMIMTGHGNQIVEVIKLLGKLTPGCAFNVALQCLEAIHYLHNAGYINRNIKPGTFSIGCGNDEHKVMMSDFRLTRLHIECKRVRKPRPTVPYLGSSRYASLAALKEKDQGRKDDLESWLYMFYEFIDPINGLSWKESPRCNMLIKEKENFKAHLLPKTYCIVPIEFKKLVDMIGALQYEQEPDYTAIRDLVVSVGTEKGHDMTLCDWFGKISIKDQQQGVELGLARSVGVACSGDDDFENGRKPVRKIMNEGDTIKNGQFTWKIVNLLGSGGFGDVYKVYDERNKNKQYALKTESVEGRMVMLRLKVEMQVLMAINEARKKDTTGRLYRHFVEFIDRGKSEDLRCKFIVMSLVGPSLDDVRRKFDIQLASRETGYIIALQTLEAVRDLHSLGYLHRDIKPANFAVGFGPDEPTVYMLDFGIGRSYLVPQPDPAEAKKAAADPKKDENKPKPGEHRAPRKSVKFLGTLRYASRACMKSTDQGRKDDLECWLYMVYDIMNDGLPWKDARDRGKITAAKDHFFSERSKNIDEDSTGAEGFNPIVKYVNELQYQQTPDYAWIANQIHATAERARFPINDMNKGGWVGKLKESNKKKEKVERFSSASGSGGNVSEDDD